MWQPWRALCVAFPDLFYSGPITTWNVSQLNQFLDTHFAPWSPALGPAISELYANVSATDPGQVYFDLDAGAHLVFVRVWLFGCVACVAW